LIVWIEELRIEGGVLDGFSQTFSPQLNVLIGGRGTGKSSVIELIRFCLGATSYTNSGQQQAAEHALGVLGDGIVTVVLTDGKHRQEVSRTAQDTDVDSLSELTPPFVFSQAEIETIGLQSQSRLRLIDGFLPLAQRTAAESPLNSKIRSTSAEIRTLLAEIDDIAEKTAELPKLQASLAALKAQTAGQTKVHQEIKVFRDSLAEITPLVAAAQVRSEAIGRAADQLGNWIGKLDDLLERKPTFEAWPTQAKTEDELAEIRKREKKATAQLHAGFEELKAVGEELHKRQRISTTQKAGLENRARDIRQKMEERQKGASALDKQIGDITQRITVLASLVDVRKEREARVKSLTKQRDNLLSEQSQARQKRTQARETVAKRLNAKLGPAVRVQILPFSQQNEYVSALSGALRGSGLRYAELSQRIAETYSPSEIAQLAEARATGEIANALEITEERALRLSDALREQAGSSLFTTIVEDDIQIELMDGSNYKGIDFLSMGQRCTAILPIILQHTERMIILDQPEDHLDNAFVVGTLVKAIAARAEGAQTLIATHNPNIPVLGDAARVIHMDSDGNRCFVRAADSIDKPTIVEAITTIMEGGREAFARRAEFYSKHNPNVSKR
jgi:DNA repair exonuclease SbcCD ATPase subunit